MNDVKGAIAYYERQIESKRAAIISQALTINDDMAKLRRNVHEGYRPPSAPVQHSATYLNTLCGELNAMLDALDCLKAIAKESP